jgi:NitT/TauT family transport system substrate-binding protein
MRRKRWFALALAAAAVSAIAMTAGAGASPKRAQLTKVTLQLKWLTQAQFAGYYEAKAKGFYRQQGLDVTIKPGGPNIIPEQVVAGGQAQFGIDWLSSLMTSRDKGIDLVSIAQVFNKSGLTLLTWKDTGLDSVAKLKDKKVANWLGGNEFEVFAALAKFGMDPAANKGVTIVAEPFTMDFFLARQADAASAMTYNELAQVLESTNPKTGKLYTLKDLNVIPMQKVGTAMLEDNVFTTGSWIKSKAHQATAKKFLAASFKGWIYCRDHYKACVNTVLAQGPALPRGHQTWQMNEINKLIWPAPLGLGIMNPSAFAKSATIVKQWGKLSKLPGHAAYRTDLAKAADALLRKQGVDIKGASYKPAVVHVTAGGK